MASVSSVSLSCPCNQNWYILGGTSNDSTQCHIQLHYISLLQQTSAHIQHIDPVYVYCKSHFHLLHYLLHSNHPGSLHLNPLPMNCHLELVLICRLPVSLFIMEIFPKLCAWLDTWVDNQWFDVMAWSRCSNEYSYLHFIWQSSTLICVLIASKCNYFPQLGC